MNLVKIKDSGYVRDIESNAILNTNKSEILKFNQTRKKILQEKSEKEETKIRLAKIEEDMAEIKKLLFEISQIRSQNGN